MGSLEFAEAAEVLEPGEQSLAELAATANREHEAVIATAAGMVMHAVRAGEALVEAREHLRQGQWGAWLQDNFGASQGTASIYMRCAVYQGLLKQNPEYPMPLMRARQILVGMPDINGAGIFSHPPEVRNRAKQLRSEGLSQRAVADAIGVSQAQVSIWLNPERAKRTAQKRRDAARALKVQQRERAIRGAVKKAGAATAEAWAMAERMQDVLAQAHRETEDREARRALSEAGIHYRKMRDEIVRALGVS